MRGTLANQAAVSWRGLPGGNARRRRPISFSNLLMAQSPPPRRDRFAWPGEGWPGETPDVVYALCAHGGLTVYRREIGVVPCAV